VFDRWQVPTRRRGEGRPPNGEGGPWRATLPRLRLLFSFVGGEGHLQPLLPLARAAAAAGHEVRVAGARSLAPVAEAGGFPLVAVEPDVVPLHVPLRALDPERELAAVGGWYAARVAPQRAAGLLALCAAWRPQVVVRDEIDFGAAVAAERLGIPHACVLVTAAGSIVRREHVAAPLAALRAEHGLPPDPALAMLSRHLVLSPFPPGFRDPADPPPPGTRAFRPDVPAPVVPPPVLARLRPGRPVVLVTLGTIFNTESGDLFARLLAGLGDLPVEVVATVGRGRDPAELGPQPAHVHVERYVPQDALLARCALAITHGGSGSVVGALAHGVPLVCVPLGADQPLNAARCAALGAGVTLDAVRLTPADVAAATRTVLGTPGFRAAAARLRDGLAALPGPGEAVALLERLARRP
jgi:UDP:flavonoid glycosyltransferase YjiC (YdhE family)